MKREAPTSPATPAPARKITADELAERTYAIFTSGGMKVDLKAYFASDAGKKALRRMGSRKVG